jgi:hypothetical protein
VVVPVAVVVWLVFGGGSALPGRIGRYSTPGLAVVATASLAAAQLVKVLDAAVRNLAAQGAPVGQEGPGLGPGQGSSYGQRVERNPGPVPQTGIAVPRLP